MKSELNVWYLDDGTLAGSLETVIDDYREILKALHSHGLEVNPTKCELFLIRPESNECIQALSSFKSITEGVKLLNKSDLTLLGAPIFPEATLSVLESKLENLEIMAGRLKKIDSHAALFLLKNCFAMPKLIYFLRSSPCFMEANILQRYDSMLKDILTNILCIKLPEPAWDQATLPVSLGGLGIRLAIEVALAGYLSSVEASSKISQSLLPERLRDSPNQCFDLAQAEWNHRAGTESLPNNKLF